MMQANEKYSWEMFWEQLLSELSISANLMHGTGKADVQWLLWKKNALNSSAVFFSVPQPFPLQEDTRHISGHHLNTLWWVMMLSFQKNHHEKCVLPELLVEYFPPALSPTPAQAGLLQQDAHSPINQTQMYRSKAGDSCQKWKRSSKLNSLWKNLKMLTHPPICIKPKI